MKRATLIILMVSLAAFAGRRSKKDAEPVMASPSDSFSYAIGLEIAESLKPLEAELFLQFLIQGVKDGSDTAITAKLTTEQADAIKKTVFESLKAKEQIKQDSVATANLAAGIAFLEENAKKEGITVTESGIQYQEITAGEGAMPTAQSEVKVHYVGTTIDGKVFDSSRERNEPATFVLERVIPGWTELVQLMSVGSTFKATFPSNLAYGERGAGDDIGPNSVLIFEIELIEVLSNPASSGDVEEAQEAVEEVKEETIEPTPAK